MAGWWCVCVCVFGGGQSQLAPSALTDFNLPDDVHRAERSQSVSAYPRDLAVRTEEQQGILGRSTNWPFSSTALSCADKPAPVSAESESSKYR